MNLRQIDWLEILTIHLMENRKTPFVWGQHDCALFVCDAVYKMTGTDLASGARGQYSTKEEADSLLSLLTGGGGLAEYADSIAAQHGLHQVRLEMAGRGDIVLWDVPEIGPALGIVGVDGIFALFAAPNGLVKNRVRGCTKAWRVP